ncbi:hypothetical protein BHE90_017191 [Fusarium euwallaceae]|uniref:Uncharacterized protein n=1 Tax=Fusarium euwallaceae TaxID=1147111 RepID=A0A430KY53_9HYPO|nr:hypothetical protein BHE90_017191 [Fusarium euwallaceae]
MHLLKSFAAITLVAAPLSTAAVALQPTRTAQLEERFGPGLPDVIEPTPKQATEAAEDEDKDKDEDKVNSRTYANHEIAEHYEIHWLQGRIVSLETLLTTSSCEQNLLRANFNGLQQRTDQQVNDADQKLREGCQLEERSRKQLGEQDNY